MTLLFRTLRSTLIVIFVLLSLTTALWALSDQVLGRDRLDVWGTKDGLPPQDIDAIAQTPDGCIWLGTATGLLRFDGQAFTLFDTRNTPSLTSNLISCLGVAPDGTLWVGIEWAGFGTFKDGVYRRVSPPDARWNVTNGFYFDRDGSVWVGQHSTNSLWHVVDGVAHSVLQPNDRDFLNVIFTTRDETGALLCGVQGLGLVRLRNDGARLPYPIDSRIPSLYLTVCCHGADGSLWVGTQDNGVFRLKHGRLTCYGVADGLPSNAIKAMLCDRSGTVWIGTMNGMARWTGKGFTSFGKVDGLSASTVYVIIEDQEGNLWVAAGGGLNRFGPMKIVPIRITMGTEIVLNTGIAPRKDGGVWISTNHGLWTLRSLSEVPTLAGLGNVYVSGIAPGEGDSVWCWSAPDNGKVTLTHLDRKVSTSVDVDPGLTCAVWNDHASMPGPGRSMGALELFGPDTLCLTDGNTVTKPVRIDTGGYVFTGTVDSTGTVWLGTNNGLVRVDGTKASTVDVGLPAGAHVLSVDEDVDGSLWLGSDHGLVHYAGNRGTIYLTADGLPDANLFEVMSTADSVWCGYHSGMFRLRKRDLDGYVSGRSTPLTAVDYGPADGALAPPIGFTYVKDGAGRLWFSGDTATMCADPSHMPVNVRPPPILITHVIVDGRALSTSTDVNRVPPGQGRFEVQYAAMSFVAPERVRFRYRLFGFDSHWVDAAGRRVASYTNLPPGRYDFHVIACNNDGVWNIAGSDVVFVIEPHFYQTVEFKISMVVAALLALVALFKFLTRQLAARAKRLEALVQRRTADLMAANDHLSEAHQELAAQNELLQNAQAELEMQNEELADMQAELESQNEQLSETQEELEAANGRLSELATTDGLTGLKNHRAFREQLGFEWARVARTEQSLSVILMDVDQFKKYNDTFGHPAGDDVLRSVASILTAQAREGDFVARYGGEEFVILLPNTDAQAAMAAAERFRAAIEAHAWTLRQVTGSFGVVTSTASIASTEALVEAADSALYASKESGRNRVTHSVNTIQAAA